MKFHHLQRLLVNLKKDGVSHRIRDQNQKPKQNG